MAQFENYLERKKQESPMTIRREQEARGLQEQRFEVGMDYLELVEYFEERMEKTSFQDRTRYYFENAGLMASKSKRYKTISQGGLNVTEFAGTHRNYSAKKRKDSAAKAAKSFGKAAVLADKYNKKPGNNAYEVYARREEIMQLRMEGMLSAAEAKSTSDDNEVYLKAKAKVSCLMILKDQARNLMKEAALLKDEKSLRKLKKKEESLREKLEAARKDMADYVTTSTVRWQNANGIKEHRYDEAVMNGEKLHYHGLEVSLEGARTQMNYSVILDQVKKYKMGFPCQVAKLDQNGQPISLADAKKTDWNQRYHDAVTKEDEETVEKMTEEALERIKNYRIPSVDRMEEYGLTTLFRRNPAEYYEMIMAVPAFMTAHKKKEGKIADLIKRKVEDRKKNDPVLREKLEHLSNLQTLFVDDLRRENIRPDTGEFSTGNLLTKQERMEQMSKLRSGEKKIDREEEKLERERAKQDPDVMSLAERKAEYERLKQTNRGFSKEDYKVFRAIRDSAGVYTDGNYPGIDQGINRDISRSYGSMLRAVHLDKKGNPVTEADRKKKEQNDRWMKAWVVPEEETEEEKARREATIQEIADKETPTIFKDFTFPAPENLLSWMKDMVKTKPFSFHEMIKRSLAFDRMAESCQPMADYRDTHPEFRKNLKLAAVVSSALTMFMKGYYGIEVTDRGGVRVLTPAQEADARQKFDDPNDFTGFQMGALAMYRIEYERDE